MEFQTRITRLTILPVNEPIFSPYATQVEIEDEAAGEFVVIRQDGDDARAGKIAIGPEEWPDIKAAIDQLMKDLRNRD